MAATLIIPPPNIRKLMGKVKALEKIEYETATKVSG